jgi:hypothetical protein
MMNELKKIIFDKLGLKDKKWKQIKLLQNDEDKKLKIKWIRTEVEIPIILQFYSLELFSLVFLFTLNSH